MAVIKFLKIVSLATCYLCESSFRIILILLFLVKQASGLTDTSIIIWINPK
jgi:hypothetical protein